MVNNNYKTEKLFSSHLNIFKFRWIGLVMLLCLSGCIKHQYKPEPIQTKQTYHQALDKDHQQDDFKSFLLENNYDISEWPIKKWDLELLTLTALYFNPTIKVAASDLAISDAREITAGQKRNPRLDIPFEQQFELDETPWLIGIIGEFLFERKEKRQARIDQARAEKRRAEINLERQAWQIYSVINKNLIGFFSAQRNKEYLNVQSDLLSQNLSLLKRRQELGQVSQFEVSSIRLQLQQLQLRVSDQDFIINNTFHNLISKTGLQADKFDKQALISDKFEEHAFFIISPEKELREKTVTNHLDIRIKLQEYEMLEAALRLEIEKQYPDINLSPGFLFEQGDAIWALGAAWVLPVFHNNEGQILEALALRNRKQAEFIELQTNILNELSRRHQNYFDKLDSYNRTQALLEDLDSRLAQIKKQFDLGYADSLSVVHAQLEYEKANQALFSIKVDLLNTLQQLEEITQQPFRQEIRFDNIIKNIQGIN